MLQFWVILVSLWVPNQTGGCFWGSRADFLYTFQDFAEFEIIAGEGEVPLARDCVESLARELGLENPESASYLELLLREQEAPR